MARPIGVVSTVLFLLLLALPVVVAIVDAATAGGTAAALAAAGRGAGLYGLALLLLAAVLSARIPRLDRLFGGLTDLWSLHHVLGGFSLVLLMAHPLLLGLAASVDGVTAATGVLMPPLRDWASWSGWAALLMMMVFLAPSFRFFGRPAYERWKKLHRLAAPAVVLALLHAGQFGALLPGPVYLALLGVLGAAAIASFVWHFGLARRLGRLRYRVDRVIAVANNVVELVLAPAGRRRLDYEAGQFVYLTPFDDRLEAGLGEEHPYTLTSRPGDPELRVAVKALGDATRALQSIRPGSPVRVEGPYGCFFPPHPERAELWIAGGIGIAPFLGRLRTLAESGSVHDIRLIYCVQDEARARFADELAAKAEVLDWFSLDMHYFYRLGPLSEDFVAAHCADVAERDAFVCGPPPLDRLARGLLQRLGVPRSRIHHESFELL